MGHVSCPTFVLQRLSVLILLSRSCLARLMSHAYDKAMHTVLNCLRSFEDSDAEIRLSTSRLHSDPG